MNSFFLKICLLFTFLLLSQSFYACCGSGGDRFTLTEILCNSHEERFVFIVKIDSSFKLPPDDWWNCYYSFAKVEEVIKDRGETIPKKVKIGSGADFVGGGRYLEVGKKYLVFGKKHKDTYHGFICDSFSKTIDDYKKQDKESLRLIRRFLKLKKSGFTGKVELKKGKKVWAKGHFLNGQPHGKWKHFTFDKEGKRSLKCKMSYAFGVTEGRCFFYETDKINYSSAAWYRNGKITCQEKYIIKNGKCSTYETTFQYLEREVHRVSKGLNKKGEITYLNGQRTTNLPSYGNALPLSFPRSYRHGPFKAGIWRYYSSTSGELIKEEEFSYPDTTFSNYKIYYENGQVRVEGNMKNNLPEDEWTTYDKKGNIFYTCCFKDGELDGTYKWFWKKGDNSTKT